MYIIFILQKTFTFKIINKIKYFHFYVYLRMFYFFVRYYEAWVLFSGYTNYISFWIYKWLYRVLSTAIEIFFSTNFSCQKNGRLWKVKNKIHDANIYWQMKLVDEYYSLHM